MEVYKLEYPVEYDNKQVTEIEIRRPKGKHVKEISGDKMSDLMGIAHHITDYTDGFFDELDAVDYLGVSDVIGGFLQSGQKTGENS